LSILLLESLLANRSNLLSSPLFSFLLLFSNHDFFSRMIGGFSGFVCRAIDRQD
jgi:hypothetical protein